MKTVLVTGSKGQLGSEIRLASKRYPMFDYIFTDIEELDICNAREVSELLSDAKIDYVINCAAYTAVDRAEEDAELCYRINRDAVEYIAEAAKENGIKVIHISTDYVFDGKSYLPYTEDMDVCPATVYGKSKLEGEEVLLRICNDALVLRTSWLYSSFGNNFVKTMLKLGRERDSLNVIFDQIGTPTYAADLADAILQILSSGTFVPGIYHYSNEGVCSWYDFAKSIHRLAGVDCRITPVESKDYPAKTPRPHYSVLNKAKIKSTYGINIPYWKDSLDKCIELMKS
jgi:dTDP-4-dehydrorhamnose reductase